MYKVLEQRDLLKKVKQNLKRKLFLEQGKAKPCKKNLSCFTLFTKRVMGALSYVSAKLRELILRN